MNGRHRAETARRVAWMAVYLFAAASAFAQPAVVPDPLVKENATVKVAAHTYVIPDGNVPLVPNVGIVIGSRATLVIDPGLGRRNGETVLREVRWRSGVPVLILSARGRVEEDPEDLGAPALRSLAARVDAGVADGPPAGWPVPEETHEAGVGTLAGDPGDAVQALAMARVRSSVDRRR